MTAPAVPAWRSTLRRRLVVAFVLLALAMTVVFVGGMQRAFSGGWREMVRPVVADYLNRLTAELGTPPDPARARALMQRLPIVIRIDGPQVQFEPDAARAHRGRRAGPLFTRHTADGHEVSFGLGAPTWQEAPQTAGWITLALLLLLTLLAYAYVRRILRPLHDIERGVERFGAGRFDQPIVLRGRDDLARLAHRINRMAADLRGRLDAQRALLLAISHELRSPLTRARLNAELLPEGEGQGAAERAALLRDLGLMRDLITDLLESERLAGPHRLLERQPVDLAALVRDTVRAHPQGGRTRLDLPEGLPPIEADAARLRLLVRNLHDNAWRHGGDGVPPPIVMLEAGDEDGRPGIRLGVRDHGPGVAPDRLDQLAQPFARTDAARTREAGGVGLGLYLCRLVVEAHGGRFGLSLAQPGLWVSAWLPLSPV